MNKTNINYLKVAPSLLAIIVDTMGFGLVYPIMTAILMNTQHPILPPDTSIQLRHFYLGLGFMLYPLCMFFGSSFMGDLSDILGRKKVLLICMVGICFSFLCMGMGTEISSIFLLMFGRALSGLMAGSQPIAQAAICDLSTEKNKALNMSMITLTQSIGLVIGPVLGGFFSDSNVISFFSFSIPFFFAAFLAFITAIWISLSFKETFIKKSQKALEFMRSMHVFYEAFKHKSVRLLSLIFLLMQVGFSLYFQLILVLLSQRYNYTSWQLGAFNGFVGLSFAIGMLLVIKIALKFWTVRPIAIATLLFTAISQIASSFAGDQIAIWILAFFVSAFDMVAFTAMLTSFSDAADKESQGWVMGISGAVMAVAWAITGLSTNLISIFGLDGLIFIGGIFLIASSLLMIRYSKHVKKIA
jgi:MFS transporter, DHA1 family, tetracycline resistance protein